MTRIRRVIKSVRRALTNKREIRHISDLRVDGRGWHIANGEYWED